MYLEASSAGVLVYEKLCYRVVGDPDVKLKSMLKKGPKGFDESLQAKWLTAQKLGKHAKDDSRRVRSRRRGRVDFEQTHMHEDGFKCPRT